MKHDPNTLYKLLDIQAPKQLSAFDWEELEPNIYIRWRDIKNHILAAEITYSKFYHAYNLCIFENIGGEYINKKFSTLKQAKEFADNYILRNKIKTIPLHYKALI
jgi:hypothetical protein